MTAGLVEVLLAARRQIAHLEALTMRATTELGHRPVLPDPDRSPEATEEPADVAHVASELEMHLGWGRRWAEEQAGRAREFVHELPVTLTALDDGLIELPVALAIRDGLLVVTDPESTRTS